MPDNGPRPKQLSQLDGNAGDFIVAQPVGSDSSKAAPAYSHPSQLYLGQGIFGEASNPSLVRGDTDYPDFSGNFDTFDKLEAFALDQTLDIAYPGRLEDTQTALVEMTINIIGDDAGFTNPPRFRLMIYCEGAITANPVYDSGMMDAPDTLTEYIVDTVTEQPTGQKRYHVVVSTELDTNQFVMCSRPFVKQA